MLAPASPSLSEAWLQAVQRLAPELGAESDPASIPEGIALKAWSEVLGVPFGDDLHAWEAHAEFVHHFPIEFSRRHGVLALISREGHESKTRVWIALSRVSSWQVLDVIGRSLGSYPWPLLFPDAVIQQAINLAYQHQAGHASSIVGELDRVTVLDHVDDEASTEDLLQSNGRPMVVQLVNSILFDAIRSHASDVHIQPREDRLVVRERIDGVLFDTVSIPVDCQDEVVSRLKVLGKMNIAEKRLPQDGRATVQIGERTIDLRIASLPTSFGERVVVRFLDKSARLYTLEELGMEESTLVKFRRLIKREHGLLLVTGPTGGGKSTTLYAALQEINCKDLNVLTLEDPIEYQLEGISQTQVNLKKGLTFASGLRNVLRQDPDIIMVGEIRDEETAVMAIQSALTGHLVLSTLHTNDAASAVTRLLDLGIEPYLVSSSLVTVVAQRLVRKICPECLSEHTYTPEELSALGIGRELVLTALHRGKGCSACRETGYQGRIGVFELLEVTDKIRDQIHRRDDASQIRSSAIQEGMRTLFMDGMAKARLGVTTLDEVSRVTVGQ